MDREALCRTLTLASAFKEGDRAVGGVDDDRLRAEARQVLLASTVADIHRIALVDDRVSEELARGRDRSHDSELGSWPVARVRDALLGPGAADWIRTHGRALSSEVIAAVAKVMTRDELSTVARALRDAGRQGGARHRRRRTTSAPASSPTAPATTSSEILFSILEGLSHGCGDVIIGLNPAADDLDTIVRLEQLLEQVVRRLELPTRFCVLSDIVKQHAAQRTRASTSASRASPAPRGLSSAWWGSMSTVSLDLARGVRRAVFRDRAGIGGHQRRCRRCRHGDAGGPHLRRRPPHPAQSAPVAG